MIEHEITSMCHKYMYGLLNMKYQLYPVLCLYVSLNTESEGVCGGGRMMGGVLPLHQQTSHSPSFALCHTPVPIERPHTRTHRHTQAHTHTHTHTHTHDMTNLIWHHVPGLFHFGAPSYHRTPLPSSLSLSSLTLPSLQGPLPLTLLIHPSVFPPPSTLSLRFPCHFLFHPHPILSSLPSPSQQKLVINKTMISYSNLWNSLLMASR